MCVKTYRNLGEELADIYKNSVCNEEYIRDYLEMVIPDMLREAARSGYQKKIMKSEDIMRIPLWVSKSHYQQRIFHSLE